MSADYIKALNDGLDSVGDAFRAEINDVRSEVNQLKAKQGKLGSFSSFSSAMPGSSTEALHKDLHNLIGTEHAAFKSDLPFILKTVGNMTLSGNLTGTSQVSYVQSPILRSYTNPHFYDLFQIIPTATGNVTFPRAASPVGEGSFGAQTEGQEKAQVDYDSIMVNTSVPFVAGYSKVSRQMLQDLPFLQAYLSSSLVEDWNRAVDNRYVATITASATTGVTSATPIVERVIDYIAQLNSLGFGQADTIITTHAVWASILKTLPTNGSYSVPGGVTFGASGETRIAGVPLLTHAGIPTGKIYVMNRSAFATAQAGGLQVRSTEFDQDDFIKNLITYRCEARVELISFQPTAAIYGSAS